MKDSPLYSDEPRIRCGVCSRMFPSVLPADMENTTQGDRCAASVHGTPNGGVIVRGHWGSHKYDDAGRIAGGRPPTGWTLPLDPVCDDCITAAIERGELVHDPEIEF